jgi:hypothetical protein
MISLPFVQVCGKKKKTGEKKKRERERKNGTDRLTAHERFLTRELAIGLFSRFRPKA